VSQTGLRLFNFAAQGADSKKLKGEGGTSKNQNNASPQKKERGNNTPPTPGLRKGGRRERERNGRGEEV